MKIEFVVHEISTTTRSADVDYLGEKISASIPIMEVQLVTKDPMHGSLTLRFTGKAAVDARARFKPDATVAWEVPESSDDDGPKTGAEAAGE